MSCRAVAARLASPVFAVLLLAAPAFAAGRDCTGVDSLKDNPSVSGGKVTSDEKRVYLIKGETDDKACPDASASCRRKAFLVPGNDVLVSGQSGDFVCAVYVSGRGVETDGWLPKSVVTPDASSDAGQDWTGVWVRQEAKVTIHPGPGGLVTIHGDATYGAEDPDRVKRGAVNIGEINGKVAPKDGRVSFSMGDNDKTEPVEKGDDSTCKVWMRRAGAYLLVDDNNACGGMNVSFRGTYVKR